VKHRLRDLLACPECGSTPLDLTVLATETGPKAEAAGTRCGWYCSYQSEALVQAGAPEVKPRPCPECYSIEITEAILHCTGCGGEYPVTGGIPRFNPDAASDYPEFFRKHAARFRRPVKADVAGFESLHKETKSSFGFQWLRYRVTDHQENRDHFYRRTATKPGTLSGQLFFEAGCGMGRYLKVFSDEPGAEVVGLDLSLAVNRAYSENRENPFIHVVQGNIMQLPLRRQTFDHVYSIGVLHHTPSTREAFRCITGLVKPGGRVSIWVYHVWCFPALTGFKAAHAKLKGKVTDTLRMLTTRMPHRLLHYLCYLAIPLGWVQARIWKAPMPVKILLSPLLLVHCSIHEKAEVRLLDTFDWYSPRYQWKHSVPEVEGWFREEGLVDIDCSGFEVSARGRKPDATNRPKNGDQARVIP
jgi:SAM-dependent methyltransferase